MCRVPVLVPVPVSVRRPHGTHAPRAGLPLTSDAMPSSPPTLPPPSSAPARPPARRTPLKPHPTREEIDALPAWEPLPRARIHLVETPAQAAAALAAITAAGVVGLDTESRPVFRKDEVSDGPHLVQLATPDEVFLVPVGAQPPVDFLRTVLEAPELPKVGFGLRSDQSPLQRKLGIALQGAVDLAPLVRRLGYRQDVGLKAAVAIVLGLRLAKSKKASTSNWAQWPLSEGQIRYAADDA
ncbi:MAG: hypothetical protein RLY78_123, partial [Pseudomonadota bacterium]